MKYLNSLAFVFAAIFLALANSAFASTNIKDPTGKIVLIVDGDNIKTDAGSKPVLTIDGDKINDAGGNLVLYINGDNIRNKPEGTLLLLIDGRHIKREIGGTNLLYIDGKDIMRGDRSGKPLYHCDGDDLGSQQRMAVLYILMPELFKGKEGDAALVAAQSKSAAESDADTTKKFVAGNYTIDIYSSTDPNSYTKKGTVAIAKVGDVFDLDFKFSGGSSDPMAGMAVQHGDQLWVAAGPPATVGLAVYKVKSGNLTGTWYNATGKPESFGTENATGADPLAAGDYKITDAKAPITLTPYTGTLTLESTGKKFDGTTPLAPIFLTAWDLGGYKAKGVGFYDQDSLVAATSTAPEFYIIRFKINIKDNTLQGQFYTAGKFVGLWNLKKQK